MGICDTCISRLSYDIGYISTVCTFLCLRRGHEQVEHYSTRCFLKQATGDGGKLTCGSDPYVPPHTTVCTSAFPRSICIYPSTCFCPYKVPHAPACARCRFSLITPLFYRVVVSNFKFKFFVLPQRKCHRREERLHYALADSKNDFGRFILVVRASCTFLANRPVLRMGVDLIE